MPLALIIALASLIPLVGMSLLFWLADKGLHHWRYRRTDPGEIHCGACRYNLRGNTTTSCPECGRDLRVAGVLSREIRHPLPLVFMLMLAVYSAIALSLLVWGAVALLIPQVHVVDWYCGFTTDYIGAKERWVRLDAIGRGNVDNFRLARATIGFNDGGRYVKPITIDLRSRTMSFPLRPGVDRGSQFPISYEGLYDEFTRMSYNTSIEKKYLMVQDVLTVIEAACSNTHPDYVNTYFRSGGDVYPSRLPAYEYNLLASCLGLVFVLIATIVAINRFRARVRLYRDEKDRLLNEIRALSRGSG